MINTVYRAATEIDFLVFADYDPIMIMYTLYLKGLLSALSVAPHPPQYQLHRPVENYPQFWFHYPRLPFFPHNIL